MSKKQQLLSEAKSILNGSKTGRAFKPLFMEIVSGRGDFYVPPEIPLPGKRRLMTIAYQLQRCC